MLFRSRRVAVLDNATREEELADAYFDELRSVLGDNARAQKYAEELVKKMKANNAKAYLVNTGWNGTGKRISIKDTRGIIDAILNGDIANAPTKKIPFFNFEVPTELPGVDTNILDPRDTYADAAEWETKAKDLAQRFVKNFAKYEGNEAGKALVSAGPEV